MESPATSQHRDVARAEESVREKHSRLAETYRLVDVLLLVGLFICCPGGSILSFRPGLLVLAVPGSRPGAKLDAPEPVFDPVVLLVVPLLLVIPDPL